jgi:hypothetical protein
MRPLLVSLFWSHCSYHRPRCGCMQRRRPLLRSGWSHTVVQRRRPTGQAGAVARVTTESTDPSTRHCRTPQGVSGLQHSCGRRMMRENWVLRSHRARSSTFRRHSSQRHRSRSDRTGEHPGTARRHAIRTICGRRTCPLGPSTCATNRRARQRLWATRCADSLKRWK